MWPAELSCPQATSAAEKAESKRAQAEAEHQQSLQQLETQQWQQVRCLLYGHVLNKRSGCNMDSWGMLAEPRQA